MRKISWHVFPNWSHIDCVLTCVCVSVCVGIIARDQNKNEAVENLFSMQEGMNESRIHLERYDMVTIAY